MGSEYGSKGSGSVLWLEDNVRSGIRHRLRGILGQCLQRDMRSPSTFLYGVRFDIVQLYNMKDGRNRAQLRDHGGTLGLFIYLPQRRRKTSTYTLWK